MKTTTTIEHRMEKEVELDGQIFEVDFYFVISFAPSWCRGDTPELDEVKLTHHELLGRRSPQLLKRLSNWVAEHTDSLVEEVYELIATGDISPADDCDDYYED